MRAESGSRSIDPVATGGSGKGKAQDATIQAMIALFGLTPPQGGDGKGAAQDASLQVLLTAIADLVGDDLWQVVTTNTALPEESAQFILIDTTAGPVQVTVPAAPAPGDVLVIKWYRGASAATVSGVVSGTKVEDPTSPGVYEGFTIPAVGDAFLWKFYADGVSFEGFLLEVATTLAAAAPNNVATAAAVGASPLAARADHAHALSFATVETVLGTASSAIGVNGQAVTGLATPVNPTDAATKAYADSLSAGLNLKQNVQALAATAIALTGTQTIDGVALVAGNRVLVGGQGGNLATANVNNGIYVVAAGAWARSADMAAASHAQGVFAFVSQGTTYGDTGFVCVTDNPNDVVGANALQFSQFSAGQVISAGNGISVTGGVVAAVAAGDGSVAVGAGGIAVGVLASDAQHGNRGGGALHATAVNGGAAGFLSGADKTKLDALPAGGLVAGNGIAIAGGTISVNPNGDGSLVVAAGGAGVGVLASDAQHGVRGGGALHANAVAAGASGFMSGADKTQLAAVAASAPALLVGAVTLVQLQAAGGVATATFNVGTLPASARLFATEVQVTQALGALGLSVAVASVQGTGDAAGALAAALPLLTVGFVAGPGNNPYFTRGGQTITVTVTLTGAVLSALTAGAFTVRCLYTTLAG